MWTCPSCERRFGRANRPHVCSPAMPVEVRLAELPDGQRRAAEAIVAITRRYRGLVIEAVGVGVFIKRERIVVELRPKPRALGLWFVSPAALASRRIARAVPVAGRTAYFVQLHDKADVDAELRGWLATALRAR